MPKRDKSKPRSLMEKTLSVRIPDDKHRALKARCVIEGISIRSLLLAVITELEKDTPTGKKLIKRATEQKDNKEYRRRIDEVIAELEVDGAQDPDLETQARLDRMFGD